MECPDGPDLMMPIQFNKYKRQENKELKRRIVMKKVEKISMDFIKPSTPTPDHFRSFNLSLLDQYFPQVFVPIILFYSPTSTLDDQGVLSERLKKSISETLTSFYPLAGRIKDNFSVDCNDEGIEYFESRLNGNMSDFMKRDELHQLLPYDLQSTVNVIVNNYSQLIVQVNFFECGGIAISVCISHKIGDAATLVTFINTWASYTREAITESIVRPTFDSSILYPPRKEMSSSFTGATDDQHFIKQVEEEKMVTRRFVFDGTKIETLRARYGTSNENKNFPTRVEAVSALIWKTAMAASSSTKPSVAKLIVDLRRRLVPPLSEQSFGNLAQIATAAPSLTETGEVDLVGPLKDSIRKINYDTLKTLQGEEGFFRFQELMKMEMEAYEKFEVYMFSSWCRFPTYEVDFGWGKPDWVAIGSQPFKNNVVLTDNKTGDGIEAWICLVEEDMAIFERDQQLLDFVSFLD